MKIKNRITRTLPLLVLAAALCGCHTTTHISREDQLSHITTAAETEPLPETTAITTVAAAETTTAETVPTTGETLPPETTKPSTAKPPATKATAPKATDPPATTIPATEPMETQTEPKPTEHDPYDISGYTCGSLEYALLDAINAKRAEAGAGALSLSGRLSAISSVRAYECSISFSHTRPDGTNCFTVLSDYGYGYTQAAENLLQCSSGYSASDMVSLWMGSKGHRDNILDPASSTVGIGVYRANGMVYVATIFTG